MALCVKKMEMTTSIEEDIFRATRNEKLKEARKRVRELFLSTTQFGCECCGAAAGVHREATMNALSED